MRLIRFEHFASFAVLSAVLSLPAGAFAQSQPAAKPVPPAPAHPKPPGSEGIAMHGHWIIDLKNPDGTIVEHRDFENSLQSATSLLQLAAGNNTVGDLAINFSSVNGAALCAAGQNSSCNLIASASAGAGLFPCTGAPAGICTPGLTEVTDLTTGNITLSGMVTVAQAGSVNYVATDILTCLPPGTPTFSNIPPSACYAQNFTGDVYYGILTGTSIAPLAATAGQVISFTVVLSFS